MQIGNLVITESASTVAEVIRAECLKRGLPYFFEFRESGSNIMTKCPFHKGGMERKPSFGISKDNMVCHCFSCGWAGGIDEVISRLFEHAEDGGDFGRRWLAQRFLSVSIERRAPLNLVARSSRRAKAKPLVTAPFDEVELDKYRFYHDYMFQRGLTEEIIERFDVGYDYETNCITFPVYHLDGSPAFIARRSVEGKFFNYPEEVDKPVYAAERVKLLPKDDGYCPQGILITESIFNCLSAWKHGWPSVSLLGLGTEFQYSQLKQLPTRAFVLGLDPDAAGRAASQKLRNVLSGRIIRQLEIPEGYDLNDVDVKLHKNIRQLPVVL